MKRHIDGHSIITIRQTDYHIMATFPLICCKQNIKIVHQINWRNVKTISYNNKLKKKKLLYLPILLNIQLGPFSGPADDLALILSVVQVSTLRMNSHFAVHRVPDQSEFRFELIIIDTAIQFQSKFKFKYDYKISSTKGAK